MTRQRPGSRGSGSGCPAAELDDRGQAADRAGDLGTWRGGQGGGGPARDQHRAAVHLAQGDAGSGDVGLRAGRGCGGDAEAGATACRGEPDGEAAGTIELVLPSGTTVRIIGQVDAALLRTVLAELGAR